MDNRWTYWACFNYLKECLDDGGIQEHRHNHVPNGPLIGYPVPGGPLDLADPALRVFLTLCGLPAEITPQTQLHDVVSGVNRWNINELMEKGIEGYECAGFEALYGLRNVGRGWDEVDRLTNLLSCSPLTELADSSKQWIWLSASDPKLGDDRLVTARIFTSAYNRRDESMSDSVRITAGAIASNYEHLLLTITHRLEEINEQATEYGLRSDCPEDIVIQKQGKDVLSVHLTSSVVDGRYKADIDYDRLFWRQHDHALLHAMLKVLPRQKKYKIQAGIFSSELGL